MLLTAALAVTTLIMAWRNLSPLPLFDQWAFVDPSSDWHGLFDVHSEHRIVLSKLVFIADLRLLGGKNIAGYFANAFMFLAMGGIYWAAVGLDRAPTWARRTLAASLLIAFTTSPLTIGVLLWGMHVQNIGVNVFAALAFLLLAKAAAKPTPTARYLTLWLAIASAFIATFTSASGLLSPFLLIAEAFVLRFHWRKSLQSRLSLSSPPSSSSTATQPKETPPAPSPPHLGAS